MVEPGEWEQPRSEYGSDVGWSAELSPAIEDALPDAPLDELPKRTRREPAL